MTPAPASFDEGSVGGEQPHTMSNEKPTTQNTTEKTHGGPRPGAGRPVAGRKRLSVAMRASSIEDAKRRAKSQACSIGQVFERLLAGGPTDNPPL